MILIFKRIGDVQKYNRILEGEPWVFSFWLTSFTEERLQWLWQYWYVIYRSIATLHSPGWSDIPVPRSIFQVQQGRGYTVAMTALAASPLLCTVSVAHEFSQLYCSNLIDTQAFAFYFFISPRSAPMSCELLSSVECVTSQLAGWVGCQKKEYMPSLPTAQQFSFPYLKVLVPLELSFK